MESTISNKENKVRDMIKLFLSQQGYSIKEVVEMMNKAHPEDQTTAQAITNKLSRQSLRLNEAMEIAEFFDYKLVFVPNDFNLDSLTDEGLKEKSIMLECKFVGKIVVTGQGKNVEIASSWLKDRVSEATSIKRVIFFLTETEKKYRVSITQVHE